MSSSRHRVGLNEAQLASASLGSVEREWTGASKSSKLSPRFLAPLVYSENSGSCPPALDNSSSHLEEGRHVNDRGYTNVLP